MKTKAKLTLAISVLSAAVLAAGVTSTFAWFTIDRTATVTYGTLTVDTISTIKIAANKLGYDLDPTLNPTGSGTNHVETKAERLGAVSSPDGKEFCAPKVLTAAAPTTNGEFDVISTKSLWEGDSKHKNKNVGFVKYAFTITADKEEDVHSLYWNINPHVSGTHIANQWRIAMYQSGTDGSPVGSPVVSSVVFGSEGAAGNKTAAVVNTDTDPAVAASAVGTATQTVVNIAESGVDKKGFGNDFTTDRKLVQDFTGADAPSLTITIAVWLEGYGLANNDASGETLAPVVTFSLQ